MPLTFLFATFLKRKGHIDHRTGPLTNIASALIKNPRIGNHLERFVSMGGTYKSHGNCSPVAEYNYWCDPGSGYSCFEKLGKTIEMVGLDVTREIVFTLRYLNTAVK